MAAIRILASAPNRKGDLFGRLMGDLFLALGYDDIRLTIHKSGREIDIEATHRHEPRRVIAECKAEKTKTGGDAINKFVGSLDAEKRNHPEIETVGYFISLSGFKETAIEQEREAGGNRVILLDGEHLIEELIKGRIIVSADQAMERAGRCAADNGHGLQAERACQLLADEIGWIWAIHYTHDKQRTHFALIHADGEALAPTLANAIVQADKSVRGELHDLTYLPPAVAKHGSEAQINAARDRYLAYLEGECGEITLEGMPADEQAGSRRLKLEKLFVPLHLVEAREQEESSSKPPEMEPEEVTEDEGRQNVGKVLEDNSRVAILATPGGGKTTLLKRLATAYAFPERRKETGDDLPDCDWLPIFIRCRQIDDAARSPITDILRAIAERAEMGELTDAFMAWVDRALRSGDALLLIDGLDEIADDGARVSFVQQLRTFLAVYPAVSAVITSREAGFRAVAGVLSGHCKRFMLADFDDDDITSLTMTWHEEVVGKRADVREEAENLARSICENDRVRQLARNPLLLTTLLLVKRWVGQLPTRRTVLYGKAIEVLLMTWNVEGHEPLDLEEVLPQLEFLAFTMMDDGIQRISSKRLQEVLTSAREQMPETLGYARMSITDFIERVELRSSLLMLSGREIVDGTLYPTYEFRHLTFQEYLAARAIADGHYPHRKDGDTLLTVLEPHLTEEAWREVVPLAAVLAGRKAGSLIRHLIDRCQAESSALVRHEEEGYSAVISSVLLARCFLDEVQVEPRLLEEGLEWAARRGAKSVGSYLTQALPGKYAEVIVRVIEDTYMKSDTDFLELGDVLSAIGLEREGWSTPRTGPKGPVKNIEALLSAKEPRRQAVGALIVMRIAFAIAGRRKRTARQAAMFKRFEERLVPLLNSGDPHVHFATCWALAWLWRTGATRSRDHATAVSRLAEIWVESDQEEVDYVAAWALSTAPVVARDSVRLPAGGRFNGKFIRAAHSSKLRMIGVTYRRAALVLAFYSKTPWKDAKLAALINGAFAQDHYVDVGASLLKQLSRPGKAALKDLKQKR